MSLLDFFTGGKSGDAESLDNQAIADYGNINTPTAQQLTIPELQQYMVAAKMTPAQMQAFMQQNNAYDKAQFDPASWTAQVGALNQLGDIADAGEKGTPAEQAAFANADQVANTNLKGQRGAIEQDAEARGIPSSLLSSALDFNAAGQDAQNEHLSDVNAAGSMYNNAIQALSAEGNLGGTMQGEQQNWQSSVANAANAMQQFNAANQQAASATNAGYQQNANEINTQLTNNASNNNAALNNARTVSNTQLPQQVFNDQMSKASGMAGAHTNAANLAQTQGQQTAGIYSTIASTLSPAVGSIMKSASAPAPTGSAMGTSSADMAGADPAAAMMLSEGGITSPKHQYCLHSGGLCLEGGAVVPGKAVAEGNSPRNDTVPAQLSPGEAVIPRTAVANHLPEILRLIGEGRRMQGGNGIAPSVPQANTSTAVEAHPNDVASLLKAMHNLRTSAGRTI